MSPIFGIDRGFPVERYYIEKFLDRHRTDVRGRCLEMGDSFYINKFGDDRVTKIDVMHVKEGNPCATIVADLTSADHVPSDIFDCIIFTQSLQMIFDMKSALRTLHRILKPGGVLLLTSHGISKIGRRLGRDGWGEYWRITTQSAERLFGELSPEPKSAWDRMETYSQVAVVSTVSYRKKSRLPIWITTIPTSRSS